METKTMIKTISGILAQKENFNLTVKYQREVVWTENKMSEFIEMTTQHLISMPIIVNATDKELTVIDGKQRLTSIFRYTNDEFEIRTEAPSIKISDGNGNVTVYEIGGKKFSQLDQAVKNKIEEYEIEIKVLENATDEECIEIFRLLNNGEALTKHEKSRAINYGPIIEAAREMSKHKFFNELVRFTNNDKKRIIDEQLAIQSFMLIQGEGEGFSSVAMNSYLVKTKDTGVSDELLEGMKKTVNYLLEVFKPREIEIRKPEKIDKPAKLKRNQLNKMNDTDRKKAEDDYNAEVAKYDQYKKEKEAYAKEIKKADPRRNLKKINVPQIILCATIAKDKMSADEFYSWNCEFFNNIRNNGYEAACTSGTASKDKVNQRRKLMLDSLVSKLAEGNRISATECNEIHAKYSR